MTDIVPHPRADVSRPALKKRHGLRRKFHGRRRWIAAQTGQIAVVGLVLEMLSMGQRDPTRAGLTAVLLVSAITGFAATTRVVQRGDRKPAPCKER
jgi:hypothetical protein